MEVWESLRSVHQARGFATTLALRRQFLTSKKKASQSMESWVGEIRRQALAMKMARIDVSDIDMILALTMGLPTAYDNLILTFDSIRPEFLTPDFIILRLLNEETRLATPAVADWPRSATAEPAHSARHTDDELLLHVGPLRRGGVLRRRRAVAVLGVVDGRALRGRAALLLVLRAVSRRSRARARRSHPWRRGTRCGEYE